MAKVFWAALLERNIQDAAVQSLLDVAMAAGATGYSRIRWPYSRTDLARNEIVRQFKSQAEAGDDCLVMLDDDHLMPADVIDRLLRWNQGVVGALAFRRGEPFFPCFFVRHPSGGLSQTLEWEPGLIQCVIVGSGAIAIRRWVFDALDEAGYIWPYFRYQYKKGDVPFPSEDVYFGECCDKAGIPHYVDTTFEIPHLAPSTVESSSWRQWQADHEEQYKNAQVIEVMAQAPSDGRAA